MSSSSRSSSPSSKPSTPSSSTDLILSNPSLRNLYQIGYNSRALTKPTILSFKLKEITASIIKHAEANTLSLRSYGPLLLGLARIYNKQIKIIYEEAISLFKKHINTEQPNAVSNEDNTKKTKRRKIQKGNKDSNDATNLSFVSQANILSLSPYQESVYSMLNNLGKTSKQKVITPSKAQIDLLTIDSKDMLRRAGNDLTSSSGLRDINSNVNMISSSNRILNALSSNQDNIIKANNFLDDSHDEGELSNFLDFIQDKVNINKDSRIENDNNENTNINIDIDFSSDHNNSILPQNKLNISGLSEIENKMKPMLPKKKRIIMERPNLIYDKTPEYKHPLDVTNLPNYLLDKLMKFNKFNISTIMQSTDLHNKMCQNIKYSYLITNDTEFTNRDKEISKLTASKYISERKSRLQVSSYQNEPQSVLKDLSKLNFEKEDFDNIELLQRKYKEEEKEFGNDSMMVNNIEYENDNDFEGNNHDKDIVLENYDVANNDESEDVVMVRQEIQKVFKKQKHVSYVKLSEKVADIDKAVLFYDLLILAQKGEMELTQKQMCDMNSLLISKV